MTSYEKDVLRLLSDVRRTQSELADMQDRLSIALGVRRPKPKPVYVRAVEWLLAALVEKPVERLVDNMLHRLDKWRSRRNSERF